ncbi:cobalt transport protein CbiN [Pseudonocardia sulfidoxydans NBRC 16205]|uniref:Cobalt transport protein CbiN n=1 Tax=Pseudonocardia sulfidoxydans NBRC 16205 TaxID=1223511 RepID=A0A511DJP3_9PSEU|nr:energy-coupling factor ABC transporter substrate-binding protein [Pseudonocardia sulfidoxydans]GEL25025.1 cobalt transport protein CbiN [Pseudonocardia sulfidoxydans NBRC 16205]
MKRSTIVNWLLVVAVVALAAFPLLFISGDYGGADGIAAERIAADHPDYQPWASSLFEPSEEVASGLFAAQAAIGAGVIGYYFGVARTRRKLAGAVNAPSDAID